MSKNWSRPGSTEAFLTGPLARNTWKISLTWPLTGQSKGQKKWTVVRTCQPILAVERVLWAYLKALLPSVNSHEVGGLAIGVWKPRLPWRTNKSPHCSLSGFSLQRTSQVSASRPTLCSLLYCEIYRIKSAFITLGSANLTLSWAPTCYVMLCLLASKALVTRWLMKNVAAACV